MIIRTCLSLLALASLGLPAAELAVSDLRVGLATRPTAFDYTVTWPTGEATGSDGFAAAFGLELGGRYAIARAGDSLGLILGLDLASDAYGYEGGGSLAAMSLRPAAGLGWALSDSLTSSLEAGWWYGRSTLNLPEMDSAPAFDASGSLSGWDLRLGLDGTLTRQLVLGGFVGMQSVSHSLTGGDSSITMDQSGWYAGLELRWRFSDAPPALE
jgi:hypothetical protein